MRSKKKGIYILAVNLASALFEQRRILITFAHLDCNTLHSCKQKAAKQQMGTMR